LDRTIVYAGQQPTDTVWLTHERNAMIALGYLAQGVLGTNTIADGLAVTPTLPASMAVQVAPGSIYTVEPVDATGYGSLPVDAVHTVVKQGISLNVQTLTLVPPSTSGQAVNYLIQAQLSEVDDGDAVLPYFNSSNPLIPYTGPNGSGVAQPTSRTCKVVVQAKPGIAATAGSQVTPSPDPGWVGLYAVTVANGASSIVSANVALLPTAQLISVKLPDLPKWVQAGAWQYATDTGTANAMSVTLNPQPSAPPAAFFARKMGSANTGGMTITIAGVGTYALLNADGTALASGAMSGNYLAHVAFEGTSYRFINTTTSTSVGSFSGTSGEGINVNGSGVVALNLPSLTDQPNIVAADLLPFYSQADAHHRVLKYSELLAVVKTGLPSSVLNIRVFTSTQTFTKTAGARTAFVMATAPGGGGGAAAGGDLVASGGGGAGETAFAFIDMTSVATVPITIGSPGLGGSKSGNASMNGADGGQVSFGTYAVANGGKGGLRNGSQSFAQGGAGGSGGTGLWTVDGGGGTSGDNTSSGCGGNSFWGAGARGLVSNTLNAGTGNGFDGGKYGGGGGGGENQGGAAVTGGNGGPGVVIVMEFS
jgi:hypothetical protein